MKANHPENFWSQSSPCNLFQWWRDGLESCLSTSKPIVMNPVPRVEVKGSAGCILGLSTSSSHLRKQPSHGHLGDPYLTRNHQFDKLTLLGVQRLYHRPALFPFPVLFGSLLPLWKLVNSRLPAYMILLPVFAILSVSRGGVSLFSNTFKLHAFHMNQRIQGNTRSTFPATPSSFTRQNR